MGKRFADRSSNWQHRAGPDPDFSVFGAQLDERSRGAGSGLSPGGVQGVKPTTEKEFQHSVVCIILGHSRKYSVHSLMI